MAAAGGRSRADSSTIAAAPPGTTMRFAFVLFLPLLALAGCSIHVAEDNIVVPRRGEALQAGTSGAWTIAPLSAPAPDGAVLRGALFRKPGARATVLYVGGNGFVLARHHRHVLRIYRDLPVDVVAFDHRGYGASDGTASLDALMADAPALHRFAAALPGRVPGPLLVHGHSLGSFIAGAIATQATLDGLVLESSATTAEDWVQGFVDRSPWLRKATVASTLQGKGNLAAMAGLDEPLLLVVGAGDTTTRPEMSRVLFDRAALPDGRKELLVVDGAGHMDAALAPGYAGAFARLLARAPQAVAGAGAAP
jgi:alpha-beta hydrolase superfamily lysophospholipase